MTDLGLMFRCQNPPEKLVEYARRAEALGYAELWLVEDCFFAGGIASAATALAATERIRVGLGIAPAVARNPAFTAMEFAALARLHPGRFLPGLGHGVGEWMRQIGAFPASQLAALEETSQAVRRLLRGERVDMDGTHVHLDGVQLEFPPADVPPLHLGVRGEKSLALAGRSADGTLLAEGCSPAYIRWAWEQIERGRQEAGREDAHHLTVYVWANAGDGLQRARAALRPEVARVLPHIPQQLAPLGIGDELAALLQEHGPGGLSDALPDAWLDELTVSGTPADCAAAVRRFANAGADAVVLVPTGGDEAEQVERLAEIMLR